MLSKRFVLFAVALSFLFFTAPLAVHAQGVSSGTVTGTVTDPSGAVIVGADVTLTDITTHASRKLVTNADGHYFFVNIPPGTYDLTVGKTGFRSGKVAKQEVTVGLTLTLNVKLEVGVATEVVEVQAGAGAELQTLNSTVGTAFSGISLESLPSISRDATTFAMLQPGVTPEGSVAGAVYDQNTFQLDGGQNTNDMDGSMNVYTPSQAGDPSGGITQANFTGTGGVGVGGGGPTGVMPTPIDSIEEFKVGTTNQTADFNSSAGAQVSMVTKRGHDAWHGTVYEYYLDDNWNANSFNNDVNGIKIPDYHYSRFGAAGGGPIVPKKILGGKTYFFGNYQGFRYPNSATLNRETPGPGLRQGLIAATVCTANCGLMTQVNSPAVFNLNPAATTYTGPAVPGSPLVNGTMYMPGETIAGTATGACAGVLGSATAPCDPRSLGINPTMVGLWNLMPLGNITGTTGTAAAGTLHPSCTFGGLCDGINVQEFSTNIALPQSDNMGIARMDHDFGDKEHFFSSYRFYRLVRATSNQTEILATPTGGKGLALANRPQIPWYFVTGLTSNLTTNFTNDFHYSYLRNWWLWGDLGGPPQACGVNCTGLGAALEPGGETSSGVLAPYNVRTQDIRTRYWDGQDHMLRDDMTRLLGNHVLQWGGIYQHNYNQHSRSDNGVGINYYPTYMLASGVNGTNTLMAGYVPTDLTTAGAGNGIRSATNWGHAYADALGILAEDQIAYTRSGAQLNLNPALTPVEDRVHIPYYNVYFTDSWHIKPTVTITYGLAWTLEMPPVEESGKQVELVDAANQLINTKDYFRTRAANALLGEVYNPELGFSLVGNAAGGLKYPYNPYYGSFSPRLAVAWSPNFDKGILGDVIGRGKTVIRGGFSIIYGRLNGVDLVLAPLLGTGLIQPVQCFNPLSPTVTGIALSSPKICGGSTPTGDPSNSFRIGPTTPVTGFGCAAAPCWDGLTFSQVPLATASATLPQPDFPGINAAAAGQSEALDPNFRPNKSYEMDFTIQRQLTSKISLEGGYIGRIIRNEYLPIQLNSVPYMFTVTCPAGNAGCTAGTKQSFQQAYANVVLEYCGGIAHMAGGACDQNAAAVKPQPFFETALAGTGYCTPPNCTAAMVANEGGALGNLTLQSVSSLWSDLDGGGTVPGFNFGNSLESTGLTPQLSSGVAMSTSEGFGNYNALFLSARMADWHGITMQSNFTYGKALGLYASVQASSGLTTTDPFDLGRGYGPQTWDRKYVWTTFLVYQPPYYKSQQGVIGHILGGWTIAPIFVTGSGLPLEVYPATQYQNGNYTSFGEGDAGGGYFAAENAVREPGSACSGNFGATRHNGITGASNGVGNSSPYAINLYANPKVSFDCFRDPILGYDNGPNGGGGVLRGQLFLNMDLQIRKSTHITERVTGEFEIVMSNVFNHIQFFDPYNALQDPGDWGAFEGAQENVPRSFEFGFRIRF